MEAELVDLDGASVSGLATTWGAQMTAYGSRSGAPFIVSFAEDGEAVAAQLPGAGVVTSVAGWERTLVVTDDGQQRHRFEVSTPEGGHLDVEPWDWGDTPEAEESCRTARQLWFTCGDEDPACILVSPDGLLRCIDSGMGDLMPGALRLAGTDEPVRVGQEEIAVYVAAHVVVDGLDPRVPSMWTFDDDGPRRINTRVRFTAITDISGGWAAWFAGHLDGRPQLVSTSGHLAPPPPVLLDPLAPTVVVATRQHEHDPVGLRVVLQSSGDGIQLWTSTPHGWLHQDLPGDTLQAARYDEHSATLYVAADGHLWRLLG